MRIIDSDRVIVPQIHHLRFLSLIHPTRGRAYPAAPMARQRSDLRPVLAAGAVTLLALLLRFLAARQSLGGDELFSLEVAFRPTLGDVIDGVRGPLEITPPGFFVFAWAFSKLGDPTYWLKAPSVLAGALTVPVIYAIGARTVGRWAGVIGGVLFAISPYAVFYGSGGPRVRADRAVRRALDAGPAHRARTRALAVVGGVRRDGGGVDVRALHRRLPAPGRGGLGALVPPRPLATDRVRLHRRGGPLHPVDPGPARRPHVALPARDQPRVAVHAELRGHGDRPVARPACPRGGRQRCPGRGRSCSWWSGSWCSPSGCGSCASGCRGSRRRSSCSSASRCPGRCWRGSGRCSSPACSFPARFVASLPALTLLVGAAVLAVPRGAGIAAAACLVIGLGIGTARTFGDFMRPPFRAAANYLNHHAAPRQPVLEGGAFDPGALEAHLHPARPVFRRDCSNASTGPGQVLTAQVHCGPKLSGVAPAVAAGRRTGRLWSCPGAARPRRSRGSAPSRRTASTAVWGSGLPRKRRPGHSSSFRTRENGPPTR